MGQLQARDFEGINSVNPDIQSSESLSQNMTLTTNINKTLFTKFNFQKKDCDQLAINSFGNWYNNGDAGWKEAMDRAHSDYDDCNPGGGSKGWTIVKQKIENKYGH